MGGRAVSRLSRFWCTSAEQITFLRLTAPYTLVRPDPCNPGLGLIPYPRPPHRNLPHNDMCTVLAETKHANALHNRLFAINSLTHSLRVEWSCFPASRHPALTENLTARPRLRLQAGLNCKHHLIRGMTWIPRSLSTLGMGMRQEGDRRSSKSHASDLLEYRSHVPRGRPIYTPPRARQCINPPAPPAPTSTPHPQNPNPP